MKCEVMREKEREREGEGEEEREKEIQREREVGITSMIYCMYKRAWNVFFYYINEGEECNNKVHYFK